MWVKRSEWSAQILELAELRLEVKIRVERAEEAKAQQKAAEESLTHALKRVGELEDRVLAMQDQLNARVAQTPAPVDLAALYEEEDEEAVAKIRARIKAEGADLVLMETAERIDNE